MRVIMAAANLSPLVAGRRAKYDGDSQVQTLLAHSQLTRDIFAIQFQIRLSCSRRIG
jgi:hypothetical protein